MPTQTICISGTSNGTGWSWNLSGIGLPSSQVTTGGVPNGGSATDMARHWVDSINGVQGNPPAYVARFLRTDEDGRAYFSITARRKFRFGVNDCTITGNPRGCSFNPTVLDITPPEANGDSKLLWSIILNIFLAIIIMLLIFLK
ncbi:MAG: hypothetical protein EVB11_11490 [Winogradskyella sp.]|nr:MAG: hypothetical protein EVB11_11490 [Winogradskyella sp.]